MTPIEIVMLYFGGLTLIGIVSAVRNERHRRKTHAPLQCRCLRLSRPSSTCPLHGRAV